MGAWTSRSELQQALHRAEGRIGRIPIEGRYHRSPRCLRDDYVLTNQCLGTGYNGAVLLAVNRHTGAKSAVKSFKLRGINKDVREDLVSEVEIFLGMDHPHVARLTEVYESESTLSLVMEYLEGGELFDRLGERGHFSEDEAAELTRQMLLAVNYLHTVEGVVHRDLKLENFLFEKKDSDFLKLIDFGFSKIVQKEAKMDLGCGTISYQAPEVLKRCYTTQCDLWSLGVMVFTLLSGRMPFEGSTDRDVARKIRSGNFSMQGRRWANISRMGKSFVQSLLVVNPEARLTAQMAQQHPWILERSLAASARQVGLDRSIADAFCSFALESRFRQACLKLMAWSLGPDERGQIRDAFLRLDKSQSGALKLSELKRVLEEDFKMPQDDYAMVMEAFKAVDICSNGLFHYSDFVAAMMSTQVTMCDGLLQDTIRRFDVDGSGCITRRKLRQVLGRPAGVDEVFDELDSDRDGRITPGDFIDYLSGSRGRNGSDMAKVVKDSPVEPKRRFKQCGRTAVWLGCMGGMRLAGKPALSRSAVA